jgi:hypothetical protein
LLLIFVACCSLKIHWTCPSPNYGIHSVRCRCYSRDHAGQEVVIHLSHMPSIWIKSLQQCWAFSHGKLHVVGSVEHLNPIFAALVGG